MARDQKLHLLWSLALRLVASALFLILGYIVPVTGPADVTTTSGRILS